MDILKLKPAVKDYIWGGTKLITDWGKDSLGKSVIAETWELSLHPDGLTRVAGGEYDGRTLADVLAGSGAAALGTAVAGAADFPVLIKLIDAKDNLSVQVHPDDGYARRVEGQYGKTEVWYIIDAEPGSGIYFGFKKRITKAEFLRRIRQKTLTEVLNLVEAKPGDVFFIEAGTVHAICKGLTLCEIQQSSNVTYRVYDYGRIGADGKERPLHIDKAADVAALTPPRARPAVISGACRIIADCRYFKVTETVVTGGFTACADARSFQAATLVNGAGTVGGLTAVRGDTFFVPAGYGEYEIKGNCTVLITTV
ncbi:MAG: class I mannose-6-phosphate isomerase [Clostridiales bacterium]|jgi:mannose-6-phosphate isomerase|nr:class I mannose-6-phosphate isomerase [Clostridiales bacterium]